VSFYEKGDPKNVKIPPLFLLPLIENCFKHISHFTDQENAIEITTEVGSNIFSLRTSNTFSPDMRSDQQGIGLINIQKRLELICRGRYRFNMAKNGNKFEIELHLDIA